VLPSFPDRQVPHGGGHATHSKLYALPSLVTVEASRGTNATMGQASHHVRKTESSTRRVESRSNDAIIAEGNVAPKGSRRRRPRLERLPRNVCLTERPRRMAAATTMAACSRMPLANAILDQMLHEHGRRFFEQFMAHLLHRNIRVEANRVGQLLNPSGKRLIRSALLSRSTANRNSWRSSYRRSVKGRAKKSSGPCRRGSAAS
jgi:hypothetical protein